MLDALEVDPPRTMPVVLLLDVSGSMRENDKIDVLNDSVTEMIEELTDVDAGHGSITLSIVTFGGDEARLTVSNEPVRDIELTSLKANGKTPMGDAFRVVRELIEDRSAIPSRSYLPTLALISDGIPTDQAWDHELDLLLRSDRGSKSARFALSIGADADRSLLARFTGGEVHEASEATQIRGFLQFVTTTITQATMSVLDPDEPDQPELEGELDSESSILRLKQDDAY